MREYVSVSYLATVSRSACCVSLKLGSKFFAWGGDDLT
jgi:hypothetical protein